MTELIKITEKNGNRAVSARELYNFLEVETPFRKWIDRMLDYGFEESKDYLRSDIFVRGNEAKDFVLTIDTAKEIAMIQRTPKGKQARQYFIGMERLAMDKLLIKNELQRTNKNSVSEKREELLNVIRTYLKWGDMHSVALELKITDTYVRQVSSNRKFNTEQADRVVKALYERALKNKNELLFTYDEMIETLKR